MTTTRIVLAMLLPSVLTSPQSGKAQGPVWRVDPEPSILIQESSAGPLFRVDGAVRLTDGRIVLAENSTRQLHVYSAEGTSLHSYGGRGPAPTEFEWIGAIDAFGDTIVAFDGPTGSVRVWHATNGFVGTRPLPTIEGRPVTGRAFLSPSLYLLTAFDYEEAVGHGVLAIPGELMLHDATSGETRVLDRRTLRYAILFSQAAGSTTYRAPFFGESQFAAQGDLWLGTPVHGDSVFLGRSNGMGPQVIALPERPVASVQARLDRFRDSLVQLTSGAVRRRIEEAYNGADAPGPSPSLGRVLAAGKEFWVESVSDTNSSEHEWFVVDEDGLRGSVLLPADGTLLWADNRFVVMLRKTELGEEAVALHRKRPGP